MNAAFLLLPFLAVRFGLMAALGRDALQRAAHFAPMQGTAAAGKCGLVYGLALTAGPAACYHRKKGRLVRPHLGGPGQERKRNHACSGTFLPLCGV